VAGGVLRSYLCRVHRPLLSFWYVLALVSGSYGLSPSRHHRIINTFMRVATNVPMNMLSNAFQYSGRSPSRSCYPFLALSLTVSVPPKCAVLRFSAPLAVFASSLVSTQPRNFQSLYIEIWFSIFWRPKARSNKFRVSNVLNGTLISINSKRSLAQLPLRILLSSFAQTWRSRL
jgi:hypothetical protein